MTAATTDLPAATHRRVARIEVRPQPGQPDPLADQYLDAIRKRFGPAAQVRASCVYLIESPLDDAAIERVAVELLADPITQQPVVGASPVEAGAAIVEVHYLPGVMDPVAQSAREAIVEMMAAGGLPLALDDIEIRTGWRFDIQHIAATPQELSQFAGQQMANTVIQEIHTQPFMPAAFPHGNAYELRITDVPVRHLDDEGLMRLSREAHLFLSLEEMRAIRDYYKALPGGGREPRDIELETLAQTWSEHCVHKTLKATIHYAEGTGGNPSPSAIRNPPLSPSAADFIGRPGHVVNPDGTLTIHNLLKSTIAAATFKLIKPDDRGNPAPIDWCVSVFEDNAGIIKFDDDDGVCIKVETHNHPSAIEPYGGAATGIGGCIRDVMGTGLAARPIANTDVFCVAGPGGGAGFGVWGVGSDSDPASSSDPTPYTPHPTPLPKGIIHPRRILQRVVAGVRDYGNRMGIPTVNGAVCFDPDYLGNPLVYCGCVGLIPLDKCFGEAQDGDRIIALGGRTGRDGIHGATFSSAELTDTHADEFSHAVQIGNAITQKKTLDVILQARDQADGPLYHAITDCGAGGFSSAIGEMGADIGAVVTLETAPLKYRGLSYTEIWISEAQERMVLAVPAEKVERLRALCAAEDVEMCDLGRFGCRGDSQCHTAGGEGEPTLVLTYQGVEVGRLSMKFLHDGLPMPTRKAVWEIPQSSVLSPVSIGSAWETQDSGLRTQDSGLAATLKRLLSHPNIASKHWIIRQYDHEVQGGSVIKPLVGPRQDGPGDAAVLRPKLSSNRGIALGCGLAPQLSEKATARGLALDGDSYWAALAAIDEAVRNVVCAGADPTRIAILDNFCWPRCDDPKQLGSLVRAAEACYDGALAYKTPFVSGKDSLSNQFTMEDGTVITIPPTLLITAMGIVPDVLKCRTMDAKAAGNLLLLIGETTSAMGGAHVLLTSPARQGEGQGAGAQAQEHEGTQEPDNSKLDTRNSELPPIRHPPSAIRNLHIPRVDLTAGPANAAAVAQLIAQGLAASTHDCSDGGLLVAAAEMAFAGGAGLEMDLSHVPSQETLSEFERCFAETPSRYLVEVAPDKLDAAIRLLRKLNIPFAQVGTFTPHDRLTVRTARRGQLMDEPLESLREAWVKTLDW
jgi:phosphoribosylformylglycinamidine synthase